MAGNVTASLMGPDLVIEGDAAANAISVVAGQSDGEFLILGGDDAEGIATSVNGVVNGLAVVAGVTGSVTFRLHEGNDVLDVANIDDALHLNIDAGGGDDTVSAANVSVDWLTIHVGRDQNVVTLARSAVANTLVIESGDAATIRVPNTYLITDCAIGGDARLNLGARVGAVVVSGTIIGHVFEVNNARIEIAGVVYAAYQGAYAAVRLTDTIVGGSISVNTSANTLLRADRVFCSGGISMWSHTYANSFEIYNSSALAGFSFSTVTATIPLHIGSTVSSYDNVVLSGAISDGGLSILTSGDVLLRYSRFTADSSIDTYYSDDTVIVDTVQFGGALALALGSGDNTLDFRNSTVAGTLNLVQGANFRPITPNVQGSSPQRTSVMTLANNRIGALMINGGDHTDIVQVLYSDCGVITASMRAGSDSIRIEGTAAHGGVRLDGAFDFDIFVQSSNSFAGLELLGFEAVY